MASASDSPEHSGSDSEHEYALEIFRTDGFWYYDAYKILLKFACLIRQTDVAHGLTSLPPEVCHHIGKFNWTNDAFGIQRLAITRDANAFILSSLHERMNELKKRHPECVYLPDDPYMNVINYFRALNGHAFVEGLMHGEDKYLLENVLPWLGLTDWGSNSGSKGGKYGGRTRQMDIFKYKLKQFLKQISPSKKRSAREPASSAEDTATDAGAATDSASAEPLSPEELREARKKYFGIQEGSRGGKRLHTRKLRRKRKSSKRSCKRR